MWAVDALREIYASLALRLVQRQKHNHIIITIVVVVVFIIIIITWPQRDASVLFKLFAQKIVFWAADWTSSHKMWIRLWQNVHSMFVCFFIESKFFQISAQLNKHIDCDSLWSWSQRPWGGIQKAEKLVLVKRYRCTFFKCIQQDRSALKKKLKKKTCTYLNVYFFMDVGKSFNLNTYEYL